MDIVRFLNLEYFYQKIYELLTGSVAPDGFGLLDLLRKLSPFLIFLILILLTLITYSIIRLKQIREEEKEKYKTEEVKVGQEIRNEKWDKVLELLNSDIPANWRSAVLEADTMLDSLLNVQGYRGENIGEKMKGIEKSDFTTLDYAWEAHKARNKIAHEGSDFLLTQREARRIINLYSRVFQEFEYI
jgi:hypothetical protein